ncbi:hypothetical protein ACWGH7_30810 [Streptomyces cyaneofuscatus]
MNNTSRRTIAAIALAGAALGMSGTAHAATPGTPTTTQEAEGKKDRLDPLRLLLGDKQATKKPSKNPKPSYKPKPYHR